MIRTKPILFSGPMVRALLDGRKTQTRRVLKPQPPKGEYGDDYITRLNGPEWYEPAVVGKDGEIVPGKPIWGVYDDFGDFGARVPYMPGDLLWVREKAYYGPNRIAYAADNVPIGGRDRVEGWGPARSSIHMPRRASRITLEVTAVRVQRLREISWKDAEAEGCRGCLGPNPDFPDEWDPTPIEEFRDLWNALNAKPKPIYSEGRIVSYVSYPWDGESRVETYRGLPHEIRPNPFVIATTFVVHQQNVDQLLAARKAA